MVKITLERYQDCVNCSSQCQSSRESFLKLSYEFSGGNIYGLVSDFGCGSWGVTTCLGGRCSDYDGKILFNGEIIDGKELSKHACFVSENQFEGINSTDNLLSAKKCIEKALEQSQLPYSVSDIKSMFELSDGRFERDLNCVSGEIWAISTAIGFALGKEIFCFPWLNQQTVFRAYKPHLDILKNYNKIILIPSSQQKELKKICDKLLLFKPGKYIFK